MPSGRRPRQPGEKYYEDQTSFGYLRRQNWTDPVAVDADRLLNDQATSNSVITTVLAASLLAQPDFARKITVTPGGTTTDVPAGDVTIVGTNIRGETITDVVTFAANASAAGSTTKAFKTVDSITFPIQDGPAATYDVGVSDAMGLDRCMKGNEVILVTLDGAYETTRPTVTYDDNEVEKNTVDPNTALDASKDLMVAFISVEKTLKVGTTA